MEANIDSAVFIVGGGSENDEFASIKINFAKVNIETAIFIIDGG